MQPRPWFAVSLVVLCSCLTGVFAEPPPVVIVTVDESNVVHVRQVGFEQRVSLDNQRPSLAIWADGSRDAWAVVTGEWSAPIRSNAFDADVAINPSSRSGSASVASGDLGIFLQPLPPLFSPPSFRGWRLLSPPDQGRLLGQHPSFRRGSIGDNPKLPATEVVLKGEAGEARITFKASVTQVKWDELTGLPETWKPGLPAGKYTLQAKTDLGPQTLTFFVEPDSVRAAALKRADALAALLEANDALLPLARTEMLVFRSATDRTSPYLADALDLLDSLSVDRRSPYLIKLREHRTTPLRARQIGPVASDRCPDRR